MEVVACVAAVIISRGSDGSRGRWLCLVVESNLSFLPCFCSSDFFFFGCVLLLVEYEDCEVNIGRDCDVVDGSVDVVVGNVVRL
jgi:hypothetical protein